MNLWNQSDIENNLTNSNLNLTVLLKLLKDANATIEEEEFVLYPIEWVIPITVLYGIIFVTGIIGNISTCVVIAHSKSLHTVTNYYLFSIAISDLLLLISGLPPEMYRIWSPETYVFGEAFCVLQGFAAETSANATVLTITAFTVERYLAICHPFLSHTMSNLSRAIKSIIFIWIVALCLAAPQAIQFGVHYEYKNGMESSRCTIVADDFIQHAFEISTFLIFVGPMTLITGLYIRIAVKLGKSRTLSGVKRPSLGSSTNNCDVARASRHAAAQNRVIKMLVAVVVAFFICWAPFHAQRLLAVYLSTASQQAQAMALHVYIALMYISGVLYFLSTTVNPLLYHIMSNKFREAFKATFYARCNRKRRLNQDVRSRTYSVLSRCPPSLKNYQRSVSDGVQNFNQSDRLASPTEYVAITERTNGKECLEQLGELKPRQKMPNKFRTRMLSQSSQTTVLTTISKSVTSDGEAAEKPREKPKRNKSHGQSRKNNRDTGHARGEKKLRGFAKLLNFFRKADTVKGHVSVESANTISNSSLQDLEEIEFSSTDLVRYMEEVNEDLT